MNATRLQRLVCTFLATLCTVSASATAPGPAREWRFNVSLDGSPIGNHRFALRERGSALELHSEARFNVKFLFFNAYRYVHDSQELWQGDCLDKIDARTDDNGSRQAVRGAMTSARFVIFGSGGDTELASCVQTFAYWNPQILGATRLLNPQTGEYVPVRVDYVGAESLTVRGTPQASGHYRLTGDATMGEDLRIDRWYSPSQEWLALESTTADGRRLHYQLQ